MSAYYNEIDPFAAQWLRNLMAAGHIPAGDVDERSIEDVRPDDLRGYEQCHFFAGIGGWAYALALAGWPPGRPVWTGSCPCQPFSQAGKGAGFDDQRHLWPAWFHLIRECRPAILFGEQVSSKDADPWIDLVHADLEGVGYAFGCIPFPAAGIGAPHIRDRNYWCGVGLADTDHARLEGWKGAAERATERPAWARGVAGGMADLHSAGRKQGQWDHQAARHGASAATDCQPFGMAYTNGSTGEQGRAIDGGRHSGGDALAWSRPGGSILPDGGRASPLHGFWGAADWLFCRDGKWRPVSPSPQPVVDGLPISLGSLRPDRIEAIKEEVNAWEMETGLSHREALRDLWNAASSEAPRIWAPGGIPGLHEAPFLLSFMRQLAQQGWGVEECLSVQGKEVPAGRMRVLWSEVGIARAPCQLRLEGQPKAEYSDALRVLSSILARHAHQAWEIAHSAYAETCHPLGKGLYGRIGRLRGYGNAIVPEAAAQFVASYLDIEQQLKAAA